MIEKKPDLLAVLEFYGIEVRDINGNQLIEEWRPAPVGYGFYEVSSLGRVRSWLVRAKGPSRRTDEPRVLTQHTRDSRGRGHLVVRIMAGDGATYYTHRLVCEAFNGPAPFDGAVVRHLDGDPTNNVPENLAWGTAKENGEDMVAHRRSNRGERCPRAKLTWGQVREIRRRLAAGETQESVRRCYGIGTATISNIATGKSWVEWA